jgi:hypothetical protein
MKGVQKDFFLIPLKADQPVVSPTKYALMEDRIHHFSRLGEYNLLAYRMSHAAIDFHLWGIFIHHRLKSDLQWD